MAVTVTVVSACGGGAAAPADGPLVVATTSIVGDMAAGVVGERGTVEVLMPPGVDPHDFQPSPRQVQAMAEADVVIAVGMGLEESLGDALDEAANLLELAPNVDPLPGDPHFWHDPIRAGTAVKLIGGHLAREDTGVDRRAWALEAEEYADAIMDTHFEVEDVLSGIPDADRKLVTAHEGFGYLAARYGFEVVGTIVPGGSTLGEPGARHVAELADRIEQEGVRVIFVEESGSTDLAEAVAAEVGGDVELVLLFGDALGPPGSGAETYLGLLQTNARRIAQALS